MGAGHSGVHCLDLVEHSVDAIASIGLVLSIFGDTRRPLRIAEQALDALGKTVPAVRIDEHAQFGPMQRLGDASDASRHQRSPHEHRFQRAERKWIKSRGYAGHFGRAKKFRDVAAKSESGDSVPEALFAYGFVDFVRVNRVFGASHHKEVHVGKLLRQKLGGAYKKVLPLLVGDSRGDGHESCGAGKLQLFGDDFSREIATHPRVRVSHNARTIEDHVDTIRIDARILYIEFFHTLAYGHEAASSGGHTVGDILAVNMEMVYNGDARENARGIGDVCSAGEVTVENVDTKFTRNLRQPKGGEGRANLGFYNFQSLILNIFGDFASFTGHDIDPMTSFDLSLSYGQDHLLRSGKLRGADEVKDGH